MPGLGETLLALSLDGVLFAEPGGTIEALNGRLRDRLSPADSALYGRKGSYVVYDESLAVAAR